MKRLKISYRVYDWYHRDGLTWLDTKFLGFLKGLFKGKSVNVALHYFPAKYNFRLGKCLFIKYIN